MSTSPSDVTRLLRLWAEGDTDALNRLVPLMYTELSRLARQRLRHEPSNCSLDTTGLVHDAYLKLVDVRRVQFRDRGHFLAMASRVMRRVLVDQARARRSAKRGGAVDAVDLDESLWPSPARADALTARRGAGTARGPEPRQGQIVEQRYFGGLSLDETAEAIGVSLATVKRELRFAHLAGRATRRTAGVTRRDA